MPRLYHSPSSIALGRRCQRAWAYCYIAGLRDPERPWDEAWATALPADVTPRQRSTALGKAMHAVAEAWYRDEAQDWYTYPAKVFLSGAHLLPHADRVHVVHVEQSIGREPAPAGADEHAPKTILRVHGVAFAGYKDLLVSAPAEFVRLKIDAPDGWLLADYKSTASIASYALTPEALADDVQCNLYGLDVCERLGLDEVPARWVYFETKRKRVAAPVDLVVTRKRALEVLAPAAALARELDAIASVEAAPCNTSACDDYGGCQYHKSRGGPCPATRTSLGKSIAQSKGTERKMSPEMQAKLDALKAQAGGAPDTTTTADADSKDEGDAPPPAKSPAKAAPRKAPAKAAPAGSLAATMSALCDELTSAEALVADVRKRMAEALA
jgi:hypothetical protein